MPSPMLTRHAQALEVKKHTAQEAAMRMQGPMLDDVIDYLTHLHGYEIARCATLDDEVALRRSQGASGAYEAVVELLRHTPAQPRRATSRREV